jgi:hypothetical protein
MDSEWVINGNIGQQGLALDNDVWFFFGKDRHEQRQACGLAGRVQQLGIERRLTKPRTLALMVRSSALTVI